MMKKKITKIIKAMDYNIQDLRDSTTICKDFAVQKAILINEAVERILELMDSEWIEMEWDKEGKDHDD